MGRTRKPPRFKSERFPIKSLSDIDCKKTARVDGDLVTLPALGHSKAQVARHVVQPLHHLGHGHVALLAPCLIGTGAPPLPGKMTPLHPDHVNHQGA